MAEKKFVNSANRKRKRETSRAGRREKQEVIIAQLNDPEHGTEENSAVPKKGRYSSPTQEANRFLRKG